MTGLRRRLVTVAKGPLQAARSPRAEEVLARPVRREETFASLAGGDHVLLVTYTRDGRAIPTPVWFALDGDRTLYVWTEIGAVKAKRLRRDPSALPPAATYGGCRSATRSRRAAGSSRRRRSASAPSASSGPAGTSVSGSSPAARTG